MCEGLTFPGTNKILHTGPVVRRFANITLSACCECRITRNITLTGIFSKEDCIIFRQHNAGCRADRSFAGGVWFPTPWIIELTCGGIADVIDDRTLPILRAHIRASWIRHEPTTVASVGDGSSLLGVDIPVIWPFAGQTV